MISGCIPLAGKDFCVRVKFKPEETPHIGQLWKVCLLLVVSSYYLRVTSSYQLVNAELGPTEVWSLDRAEFGLCGVEFGSGRFLDFSGNLLMGSLKILKNQKNESIMIQKSFKICSKSAQNLEKSLLKIIKSIKSVKMNRKICINQA